MNLTMKKIVLFTFPLLSILLASCAHQPAAPVDERLDKLIGKWMYSDISGYVVEEDGGHFEVTKLSDVDTADSEVLVFKPNNIYTLTQPNYSEIGAYELRGDTILFTVGADCDEDYYRLHLLNDSSLVLYSFIPEEELYIYYTKVED